MYVLCTSCHGKQSPVTQRYYNQWLKWYALASGLSQVRSKELRPEVERERGSIVGEGAATPPHQLGLRDRCKLPSGVQGTAPEEAGFSLFLGFKNLQFLSTTHCSRVILTANINNFALTLGMTVVDSTVCTQIVAGMAQGKAEPTHFSHWL